MHQDACAANRASFDKPDDRPRSAMAPTHQQQLIGGVIRRRSPKAGSYIDLPQRFGIEPTVAVTQA